MYNIRITSTDEDEAFEADSQALEAMQQSRNNMNATILKNYENAAVSMAKKNPEDTDRKEGPSVCEDTTENGIKSNSSRKTKRRKISHHQNDYQPPSVRYSDLGGVEKCIEEVRELIEAPLTHPEIYRHLNIEPPRGVLLHGPPGCGKTQLAKAISGELQVPFIQISAPSIVSGMSGESEKKIREVFDEARQLAPCILFLDEIDAITPKRETAQREMERRIVAQLLTCLDDLSLDNTDDKPVMVIGATNRPDSLDPALRRAGRFDREISMGIPNEEARIQILKVITNKLRLSGDLDFTKLAKLCPGYVGADLTALTTAAGIIAVKRIFGKLALSIKGENEQKIMDVDSERGLEIEALPEKYEIAKFLEKHPGPLSESELAPLSITMQDFEEALKKVQPSSKREGFASVPDVSWDDIGALGFVRDELRLAIVEPIKHPELFQQIGIYNASGVLLWGPPGCGKTLLAKAVANESHCNFISVKGPELLNKFVGESERGVRQVFARARASAPCVIFFDELDALCPKRGNGNDSQTSERVVNQLLTEMDGLEGRNSVYIIAATNRPDIIDRAILRPGRFDKLLYVRLPNPKERLDILKTLSKKIPLSDDVDLEAIAYSSQCERFSGADLSSLIREAGVSSLREALVSASKGKSVGSYDFNSAFNSRADKIQVCNRHFETALSKIVPSVTTKDLKQFDILENKLSGCVAR